MSNSNLLSIIVKGPLKFDRRLARTFNYLDHRETKKYGKTENRKAEKQKDRKTEIQKNRNTEKQKDRKKERQKDRLSLVKILLSQT